MTDPQNLYILISKVLDASAVNGTIPYHKLTSLVKQYGNRLQELPLSVLHGKKFEVKPGVIIYFTSETDGKTMLKDISFDYITGVKFSYKDIHYSNMEFTSGTNQVIFEGNGIKLLDPNDHPIGMSGEGAFSAHHDL